MNEPDTIRLRVLHTNDIHSRFGHMPRIASVIRTMRAEMGEERTIVLDIGDHMDRMFPETEGTDGAANIAVLNATGYDAVTLGNNEGLTYGKETLDRLYGQLARFPVAAGNLPLPRTEAGEAWTKPYVLLERNGLKVGLIGVTAYFHQFYRLLGWDIREPFDTVARLVSLLRQQTDVLIVMSHLGLRADERLATDIPGIDLILGGHTHHVLEEPLRIGNTLVCAAGKFGQYVGVVDLDVETAAGGRTVRGEGRLIPVEDWPAAPDVEALISRHAETARIRLERETARLQEDLEARVDRESRLGNMLAAGLRKRTGAEIGLVNAGQLLGGLPRGPVSAGTLLKICPSPINPCRMELKGAQLLEALEQSLLPEYIDKPLYGFGFRGKVLGTLCVDGLRIEYDAGGPPLGKIRSVWIGPEGRQRKLVPQDSYTVGTIDMFTFGIGYLPIAEGTGVEYLLPDFLRDVLQEELADPEAVAASATPRWLVIAP